MSNTLDEILAPWVGFVHSEYDGTSMVDDELAVIETAKQQIQALITEATVDAYELLRWKYKELNHQTISKEFLEAYNTLMEAAQLKENN